MVIVSGAQSDIGKVRGQARAADAGAELEAAAERLDAFAHVRDERIATIDTDSHTFARSGDLETVLEVVYAFIDDVEKRA